MKISIRNFSILFAKSAWEYTRPILSFDDRHNRSIIFAGIILSNSIGVILTNITPLAFMLVNVGSFLGTVICTLPKDSHPAKNAIEGIILISTFTSLGIFLQHYSYIIILLLGCSLYISGVFQNINTGTYVNWIFGSISLLAGTQLKDNLAKYVVFKGLLAVIIGMLALSIIYCIFSKNIDNDRLLVERLYKQIYLISKRKPSKYIHARVQAQTVIDSTSLLYSSDTNRLKKLINQADLIVSSLNYCGYSEKDSKIIMYIEENLIGNKAIAPIDLNESNPYIKQAALISQIRSSRRLKCSDSLLSSKKLFYKLRQFGLQCKNPPSKFAMRLALTGVVCHIASIGLNNIMFFPLKNHEFWVVITGCLMTTPGFHGTLGKIASRSIGSIVGVFIGSFLHLLINNTLNLNYIWMMIVACLLVILYEAVRKLSQAFLMVSVTTWITFILGGSTAGFTRLIDVLIGATIALIIFLVFPTWHIQHFQKDLEVWSNIIKSHIINLAQDNYSKFNASQWSAIYGAQKKLNKDIQESILESPLYSFDTSSKTLIDNPRMNDTLIQIQEHTEKLIFSLISLQYYLDSIATDEKESMRSDLMLCSDKMQSLYSNFPFSSNPFYPNNKQVYFINFTISNLSKLIHTFSGSKKNII
ncbi:FUSC family protein [Enterococcus casseliflavus]|uniref:FUSC family protein n=1 Tax=Enterococcus casseliflavus TaxID=37734 RepID=UPI0011A4D4AA|nr:FUSC family protein [Enterococcus casseliflavus]